eukprot:6186321-Pleurochrysis_carterae.AAC.4
MEVVAAAAASACSVSSAHRGCRTEASAARRAPSPVSALSCESLVDPASRSRQDRSWAGGGGASAGAAARPAPAQGSPTAGLPACRPPLAPVVGDRPPPTSRPASVPAPAFPWPPTRVPAPRATRVPRLGWRASSLTADVSAAATAERPAASASAAVTRPEPPSSASSARTTSVTGVASNPLGRSSPNSAANADCTFRLRGHSASAPVPPPPCRGAGPVAVPWSSSVSLPPSPSHARVPASPRLGLRRLLGHEPADHRRARRVICQRQSRLLRRETGQATQQRVRRPRVGPARQGHRASIPCLGRRRRPEGP